MTVIATDGHSMAGDTMTSGQGEVLRFAPKVHRLEDGRIVGACGSTTECVKLVRWLSDGGEEPKLTDDVCAIILNPDGTVDWIDKDFELITNMALPYAIGTGGEMALGAMLGGAIPEEAAMIAMLRRTDCGGEVTVISLPDAVIKLSKRAA